MDFIWNRCLIVALLVAACKGWVWKCNQNSGFCARKSDESAIQSDYPSIEVCRLVCGKYRSLWPQPTGVYKFGTGLIQFDQRKINVSVDASGKALNIMYDMVDLFRENVRKEGGENCDLDTHANIKILISQPEVTNLGYETDEGYELETKVTGDIIDVKITATTIFGGRHGLETLSQLITSSPNDDRTVCSVTLTEASVHDAPLYPHRGLLLDTARNFVTLRTIMDHIDGMAASKLNILHWHVTDSQSWPLDVPDVPNMTKYGAYSSDKIYSADNVSSLVNYARVRGIKIIPEVDAPSHSGNGWQWGDEAALGPLAVCVNQGPYRRYCIEPPCGQLNPANPNLYHVLGKIYDYINKAFPSDVFHMGGDEIFWPCWNSSEEVLRYIGQKPRSEETFLNLWSEFQEKALNAFDSSRPQPACKPIIMWSSDLTDPGNIEKYLSKDRYIIQTWVPRGSSLPDDLLKLGYKLIISTKDAWYLDRGFWGGTPYADWKKVYQNTISRSNQVLGGEVCMWGEWVEETSVVARTWPRAAAAAERLWADPSSTMSEVTTRFYRHRERLATRGINTDAVGPRWCYQNEGACN